MNHFKATARTTMMFAEPPMMIKLPTRNALEGDPVRDTRAKEGIKYLRWVN
jgi:hypothetical protein